MTRPQPLNVAVIGAGIIGIDLVTKINRSQSLDCRLVVGRDDHGLGLRRAADLGCETAADGINSLVETAHQFDIVFDATNAVSHAEHWSRLQPLGTKLVDLTPSNVGHMVVPPVNGTDALMNANNVNLISCGGQAAVPLLHALTRRYKPDYIEVVTTVASASVGRATRLNLDEYIATTQDAVRTLTGVHDVKVVVNLSPAWPPATFRVAMSVVVSGTVIETVRALVAGAAEEVRAYAPGYEVTVCTVTDERVFIAVEVTASGDRIPRYAGNLDIINSAAVLIAEQYAAGQNPVSTAQEMS